jgi:hypothetical protein
MIGDVDCALVDEVFLPPVKGVKPSYGVSQKRLEAALPKMDTENLGKAALALIFSSDADYGPVEKRLKAALKHYDIDIAAVKAAAKIEVEKALAPSADGKPKKKPAKKS